MATGTDPDDAPDGADPSGETSGETSGGAPNAYAHADDVDDAESDIRRPRQPGFRAGPVHIVVPIRDDAARIGAVVTGLRPFGDVIVVDDASTDDGAEQAARAGAIVIRHGHRLGPDQAVTSGFVRALELGATTIVTTTADLHHDPAAVADLVTAREVTGAEIVLGTRRRRRGVTRRGFELWSRFRFGLGDPLCPLRAFDADLVARLLPEARKTSYGTALTFAALRDDASSAIVEISDRDGAAAPALRDELADERRVAVAFGTALLDDMAWTLRTALTRR